MSEGRVRHGLHTNPLLLFTALLTLACHDRYTFTRRENVFSARQCSLEELA